MSTRTESPPDVTRHLSSEAFTVPNAARIIAPLTSATLLSRMVGAIETLECDCACYLSIGHDDPVHGARRSVLARCSQLDSVLHEFKDAADCPWLYHASVSSWPVSGSDLHVSTPRQRLFASLVRNLGFASVLVLPAPTPRSLRHTAVLVLGSEISGFFERVESPVAALAYGRSMDVSRWHVALLGHNLRSVCRLSTQEVSLLRCELDGMSSKEISRRIGVPFETIDCRFQRLCAKLRAGNRRQALQIAIAYGFLEAANDGVLRVNDC